jgi:hypothetical protein
MMNVYNENGYFVIKQFFENDEIQVLPRFCKIFMFRGKVKICVSMLKKQLIHPA